jgi:hypothetical protein
MAGNWRDQFQGWSDPKDIAPPNSPAGGGGPGSFRQPPQAGYLGAGSSLPHPNSPAARLIVWHLELPQVDFMERVTAVYHAITVARDYVPKAVFEATGQELGDLVKGLIPGLLMFMGVLGVTTAVGTLAGAALGAILGGGVGALPGAGVGAEAGFDLGLALLNYLGVGFLVVYIGKRLLQAMSVATGAIRMAWDSVDNPTTERLAVDRAARKLAYAVGLVIRGLLQGIVAYLLAKGTAQAASRVPELVGRLRASKLGAGFAGWIERNWKALIGDTKLQDETGLSDSGSGGGGGGEGGNSEASKTGTNAPQPTPVSKAPAPEPPKAAPAKSGAPPGKYPYDLTKGVDTGQPILFGQKGVSPNFSDGGLFKGADVNEIAAKLKSGELSPDDLPVKYIWVNGAKVVVNNRSLTALSKAGMAPTNTIDMTGKLPASGPDSLPSVLGRLDEMGGQPSTSIPIRSTNDWNSPPRETVTIPGPGD